MTIRLLLLAPFPPRLDATHGGSRAVAELVLRLAARHRVALLALRGQGEPPVDTRLRNSCEILREVTRPAIEDGLASRARVGLGLAAGVPMWVSGWSVSSFRAELSALAAVWRPDVVQAEYHLMAQYFDAVPHRPARVLRQLEPGAATAGERAKARRGPARLLSKADGLAWRRYERRAMRQADVVAALTREDEARLAPFAGTTPIVVIPLGVHLPDGPADPRGRCGTTVLFVGNFVHPPNQDAARRLLEDIFPRVRAQVPHAELRVVGPNPPAFLASDPEGGVTVTGEVPSVWTHLEDAAVVIAPLRQGGGMRVKVAEALAAGKAVVATRLAAEGLGVQDGEQLLLADTSEALAGAVVSLLGSPERRITLALAARAWAMSELGWDGPAAAFSDLYEAVLHRGPA